MKRGACEGGAGRERADPRDEGSADEEGNPGEERSPGDEGANAGGSCTKEERFISASLQEAVTG